MSGSARRSPRSVSPGVRDVLGVGFGPSNLALAIALDDHNAALPAGAEPLDARFVERQDRFGWHRGMLLEDATMQVSFLKDLATLRNPCSAYSFVSYLHARERLVDFINFGSAFPTRPEFHDYLEWAAEGFTDRVDYGTEVVGMRLVDGPGGPADLVEVDLLGPDGPVTERARTVVLGTGLVPHVPEDLPLGERVWHSRDLLTRLGGLPDAPRRVTVVGAGQSAAEVVDHLHRTYADAEVCAVFARYGFSPADDSSFANRVFDPDAVDDFFTAPREVKDRLLDYHGNTNYSVVDPELIDSLYRRHYAERVAGRERLRFLNVTRVAGVTCTDDGVEVELESLIEGDRETLRSDLVVYATGYRTSDPLDMLGDAAEGWERDEQGRPGFHRDYRVKTPPEVTAGLYAPGATEHTHGLTSTLLSNVAVRAGEMVASIAALVAGTPAPRVPGGDAPAVQAAV